MSFDSDYLDLAIGLAVVLFLASLVVSGLNEAFAWLFRRRAKYLWGWLFNLVSTDNELKWDLSDLRPKPPNNSSPSAPPAPGSPEDVTSRLLGALSSVSPTGAKDEKTTIKHIPPSSLAQAFLEVFGDLGRAKLAAHLPGLLSDEGATRTQSAVTLGELLARPPERTAEAVTQVFQSFADDNQDASKKSGAIDGLIIAIAAQPGANASPALRKALADFVAAAEPNGPTEAEGVISALARTFPDVLVHERLQASFEALGGAPLAPTLKRLWDTSAGEMDKFRGQLEGWLQGELDRLGGFYKRSIRYITLIFVVVITLVLNIDAIGLTQNLWRHPDGRAALVGFAQQSGTDAAATSETTAVATTTTLVGSGQQTTPTPSSVPAGLAAVRVACEVQQNPTSTTAPAERTPTTTVAPEAAARSFADISNCVADAVNALSGLDVIDTALVVNAGKWWDSWSTWGWLWWRHLLGLIATGAALFLGAPFWFDIVKRLTGIRKGPVGNT